MHTSKKNHDAVSMLTSKTVPLLRSIIATSISSASPSSSPTTSSSSSSSLHNTPSSSANEDELDHLTVYCPIAAHMRVVAAVDEALTTLHASPATSVVTARVLLDTDAAVAAAAPNTNAGGTAGALSSSSSSLPPFSVAAYYAQLKTQSLGRTLAYADVVSSTQQLLHGAFATLPQGAVFACDRQRNGKGRGTNTWSSPRGCLMTSFTTVGDAPEKKSSGKRASYFRRVLFLLQ
jgi:hypothetical protein